MSYIYNCCKSLAINPHVHGREKDVDPHLCDVCYWRKRAQTNALSGALRESVQHQRVFYELSRIEQGAVLEYVMVSHERNALPFLPCATLWLFMLIAAEALQEIGL